MSSSFVAIAIAFELGDGNGRHVGLEIHSQISELFVSRARDETRWNELYYGQWRCGKVVTND